MSIITNKTLRKKLVAIVLLLSMSLQSCHNQIIPHSELERSESIGRMQNTPLVLDTNNTKLSMFSNESINSPNTISSVDSVVVAQDKLFNNLEVVPAVKYKASSYKQQQIIQKPSQANKKLTDSRIVKLEVKQPFTDILNKYNNSSLIGKEFITKDFKLNLHKDLRVKVNPIHYQLKKGWKLLLCFENGNIVEDLKERQIHITLPRQTQDRQGFVWIGSTGLKGGMQRTIGSQSSKKQKNSAQGNLDMEEGSLDGSSQQEKVNPFLRAAQEDQQKAEEEAMREIKQEIQEANQIKKAEIGTTKKKKLRKRNRKRKDKKGKEKQQEIGTINSQEKIEKEIRKLEKTLDQELKQGKKLNLVIYQEIERKYKLELKIEGLNLECGRLHINEQENIKILQEKELEIEGYKQECESTIERLNEAKDGLGLVNSNIRSYLNEIRLKRTQLIQELTTENSKLTRKNNKLRLIQQRAREREIDLRVKKYELDNDNTNLRNKIGNYELSEGTENLGRAFQQLLLTAVNSVAAYIEHAISTEVSIALIVIAAFAVLVPIAYGFLASNSPITRKLNRWKSSNKAVVFTSFIDFILELIRFVPVALLLVAGSAIVDTTIAKSILVGIGAFIAIISALFDFFMVCKDIALVKKAFKWVLSFWK